MINIPKDLSDIEVGLYKSGYGFCEKLVKEEHMAISAAVEKTAAKFGGLNMISDMDCFKKFLLLTQSLLLAYVTQIWKIRLGGMSLNKIQNSSRNIGVVTMTIC